MGSQEKSYKVAGRSYEARQESNYALVAQECTGKRLKQRWAINGAQTYQGQLRAADQERDWLAWDDVDAEEWGGAGECGRDWRGGRCQRSLCLLVQLAKSKNIFQ